MLSERKTRILEAIINDYIATAEPIGSRTIAKKYSLGISSATIRNEMSDLEDLGLIVQPHTSSGRIPSDKGYRLYVDSLMRYRELTQSEIDYLKAIISNNISRIDYLMKETARAISLLTNYTAIISQQEKKSTKIKHIQLVPYDDQTIIAVVITDTGMVKNIPVRITQSCDIKTQNALSEQLNACLCGKTVFDLPPVDELVSRFENNQLTIFAVLNAIINEFCADTDLDVYTTGTKNILGFPEFSNIERAKEIFQALEEKQILSDLLKPSNDSDIEIVIGDENSVLQMKNCSVIKAGIGVGGQKAGRIGIIGPTRMDYAQVSSVLNGIVKRINAAINEMGED